jgi:hypothetical protein
MFAYLEHERKWYFLFFSAASAALAQLTKSSSMAMLPVIGLMLAVSSARAARTRGPARAIADHLKMLGLWILGLAAVYFVLWPGMWVAPGKMLYEVYGNAFSYAFQGARLQVTQELNPSRFSLAAAGGDILGFSESLAWRATPAAWFGFICILLLLRKPADASRARQLKLVIYLIANAFLFILLYSLAQGRNSAHYIMASHVSMDAAAALGWCALLEWIGARWKPLSQFPLQAGVAGALILIQTASGFSFYPYYYPYSNPLMVGLKGYLPLSEYGEGFEQAAAYLAGKPNSESLHVFSFRARGPFSYFFPGETVILNPLFMEEPRMGSMRERLSYSDYLVINDALGPRTERTKKFVEALAGTAPERSIYIHGLTGIHVYRVSDLPPSFYETISE